MYLSMKVTSAPAARAARMVIFSLALIPQAAAASVALPLVGAQIGASTEEVRTVMDLAGCPVQSFAAEGASVAVQCRDETGLDWRVLVDPTTGRVTRVLPLN